MRDHAIHMELVEIAERKPQERRRHHETAKIVQNGIAMATMEGEEAGAKYLREREIPIGVTHRVLAAKQRRAGDWA